MNKEQMKNEIKKIVETECPICYREYDDDQNAPMLICSGQHCICMQCVKRSFQILEDFQPANCPICNQLFVEEEVSRFRLMGDVVQMSKLIDKFQQLKSEQIQALQYQNEKLATQLIKQKDLCRQKDKELLHLIERNIKAQPKIQLPKARLKNTSYYLPNQANKYKKSKKLVKSILKMSCMNPEKKEAKNKSIALDESDLFLNSRHMQSGKKNRLNHKQLIGWKSNKALPYFANKKCITVSQLKQIHKRQNKQISLSIRQACIDTLQKYDFSQVQEIDLFGLHLFHQHLAILSPNNHTLFRLSSINLSKNKFSEMPQFLFQIINLKEINLNHNIIVKISQRIAELAKLQRLYLWNNKLALLPNCICSLQNLRQLELSNNCFQHVPDCLLQNKKLKKMSLYGNPIKINQKNKVLLQKYSLKKVELDIN